jgi:hypothetical protein
LDTARVTGCSRVPLPPASTIPFMARDPTVGRPVTDREVRPVPG